MGVPDRLHAETTQCVDFRVAKIFVKADLTKELPRAMNFTVQGKEVKVEYSYPWLPAKCTRCGKWGHSVQTCVVKQNSGEENEAQKEIGKEVDQEKSGEATVSYEGTVEKDAPAVPQRETSVDRRDNMEKNNEVNGQENEWQTVSPGKVCRSAEKREKEFEYGQVSILSRSRFSVLSLEDEEGEITDSVEDEKEKNSEDHEKSVERTNSAEKAKSQESQLVVELEKLGEEEVQHKNMEDQATITPETEKEVGKIQSAINTEEVVNARETQEKGVSQTEVATGAKERDTSLRPSLPRNSKDRHKFLCNSAVQKAKDVSGYLNTKSVKKNC